MEVVIVVVEGNMVIFIGPVQIYILGPGRKQKVGPFKTILLLKK